MRSFPLFLGLLVSTPAWADRAAVQVGDHRNLGRVVISLDSTAPVTVRQRGNKVEVSGAGNVDVASPDTVPRNVLSFTGGHGSAHLTVIAGAQVKSKQEGRTLLIDVLDPAARGKEAVPTTGTRQNPGKPAVEPQQVQAATTKAEPPAAQPAPLQQQAEPVAPPEATPAPAPSPPKPIVRAVTLNVAPDTGAASFRRGDLGVVVLDDAVTLADPDEGEPTLTPELRPIQRGTLMTVPLAGDETLAFRRSADNLIVTIAPSTGSPATATAIPAGVQYQVNKPGRAMTISDPVSGQTMLIGTTRQFDGDHAMIDLGRSAPGYVVVPTWLGLALDASSDQIDLKVSLSGYTLSVADPAAANATAAARQENQFNIPVAPTEVLVRQLSAQIASAASAPPRSRGRDRIAAARTMLALGMSAESAALLGLAAADDPAIARDPSTAALTGVAAVLAGRPAEAAGLDNPALPTGGDIALWRGLRDVAEGRTAPALAGAWPLLSAYPDSVRRQIAPAVLEAAARNGADVPAQEMEGPSLALARALKLAHDEKTAAALIALDAVKNSRNERDSVRASIAATELRLQTGEITPSVAAEQLDRQTIRWRGGLQELTLRLRVAALRTQAGQWRAALESLQQAESVFPDAKPKISELKTGVFQSLLSETAPPIAPLDLVSIAGDFADCVPGGADGDRLAGLLADKLAALDLPARAILVLQRLIDKGASPAAKAEFGLRLAQMQLDAGDAEKAETLLLSLEPAPTLENQRAMLLARARAARSDFAGAAAVLLTVSTAEADEMRAAFYAKAGDWQRSLETLEAIAAANVPNAGDLDDKQQDLILREATAAVQAGNADAVKRLAQYDKRLTPPRADLFRVLTATAVNGPDDLPRAARELAMSRAVPDRLSALKLR